MGKRRAKILVVDGEREASLALHRVLYESNHRFDVLLAATTQVARDIMRDQSIDVLVTDADLPSGVDLVCWAAIEFPEIFYVVKTSHDVQKLEESISGLGCLRLLRKPCEPRQILKIVHEALDSIQRLSGCLSTLSAADLIQMLCLAKRTAAIRIASPQGLTGTVMIKNGRLVHADWGNCVGQAALCEIIAAEDGVFRTTPLPEAVEPTIHEDWQHALMDAVRVLDERANVSLRQSGSFPAIRMDEEEFERITTTGVRKRDTLIDARTTPRTPSASSSLVDKGFAALRAGDLDEARQCWLAAKQLDPENRSIDLNLRKLDSRAVR